MAGGLPYFRPGILFDDPDVFQRAELQVAAIAANILLSKGPGTVIQGINGPGNPIPGWTAQRGGPAFGPPYTPTLQMPNYADADSAGGRFDQNPVWAPGPVNPLGQAPCGSAPFDGYSNQLDDPNHVPNDVGGGLFFND